MRYVSTGLFLLLVLVLMWVLRLLSLGIGILLWLELEVQGEPFEGNWMEPEEDERGYDQEYQAGVRGHYQKLGDRCC